MKEMQPEALTIRPGSPDPQGFPEGSDPILLLAQYMSWAHKDIFLNSSGTKHHLN